MQLSVCIFGINIRRTKMDKVEEKFVNAEYEDLEQMYLTEMSFARFVVD